MYSDERWTKINWSADVWQEEIYKINCSPHKLKISFLYLPSQVKWKKICRAVSPKHANSLGKKQLNLSA